MNFDAVIFDMDGLMLDTEQISATGWRLAGAKLGIPVDEALIHGMVGLAIKRCEAFAADYLGDAEQARVLLAESRRQYRQLIEQGDVPLKPGILNVLQWLDEQGMPRAVATSTQRDMARLKLMHTGLERYFSTIVTVDDVAEPKPAPDVYLSAAARLDISPARCIALEDSPLGMQAALSAGMRVIQVPDIAIADPNLQAQALAVCEDLNEALALLKML